MDRPFSWMNSKLEVKDTEIYGIGVFAKDEINNGELLFVMGGYIVTIDDDNNYKDKLVNLEIDISEDFSLAPLHPEHMDLMPQHYVNHSCEPNAGFKAQLFLVAMRPINKGEEVTLDYAMCMKSNKKSKMRFILNCLCGSTNCRKIINEDDWKIPELQDKYDGFFQWFIQEQINKTKKHFDEKK